MIQITISRLKSIIFKFIWSFKKGDNILYNYSILIQLYEAREEAEQDTKILFNKPIVLIIASMVECILDDFIKRIQQFKSERVPGLSQQIVTDLRYVQRGDVIAYKRIDTFDRFIGAARKHLLFGRSKLFYTHLKFLARVRNRIHIQNEKDDKQLLPLDEYDVFTDEVVSISERLFMFIVKFMMKRYPRIHTS